MQRSLKMSICKIWVAVQIHWPTCRGMLHLVFPVSFKWIHFVSSFFWYQFLILVSLKVSLRFSETNKGKQSSLSLQINSTDKLNWTSSTWIQCSCFYLCNKVSTFLINVKVLSVQYFLLPLPHQYCSLLFLIAFLYFLPSLIFYLINLFWKDFSCPIAAAFLYLWAAPPVFCV